MEIGNIKDEEVQKHSSGRLTKLYIVALSAVALLTISGQLLIQRVITNQLNDSYVVNMAGRQRYTSQEICKLCLLIQGNISHKSYPDIGIKLDSLLSQWKERHVGLLQGNEKLKLPATESKSIKEMFTVLEPYFYEVYANALVIAQESKKIPRDSMKIETALRGAIDNEKIFLEHMNEIVYQYDYEARAKVLFLKNVELMLFILTILILLAEGFFIFRPVSKKIKTVISELMDSEHKALALTHKLRLQITHWQNH